MLQGDVDEQNIELATDTRAADQINAQFYGEFPYPARAQVLSRFIDTTSAQRMLCQAVGDWEHKRIPDQPRIWVAGCGTNQAVLTALRFPDAEVIGSDISAASLDICRATADDVGADNLTLRDETINDVSYQEEFDYVICTGVIHHNADPARALRRLRAALKPTGILELMVYNRFHRLSTSAFQKALRLLTGNSGRISGDVQKSAMRGLMSVVPPETAMAALLQDCASMPAAHVADRMMQPIEHSYTVATVSELVASCGLQILGPCPTNFSRASECGDWELCLADADLRDLYVELPDCERWQFANLILGERSPLLWFYVGRSDAPALSQRRICEQFLERPFERASGELEQYTLGGDCHYRRIPAKIRQQRVAPGSAFYELLNRVDRSTPLGRVLSALGFDIRFPEINNTRLKLTTPAYAFLQAVV